MTKSEIIYNEIKKLDRFKEHIVFFMMEKYGFILDKDVEKFKKIEHIEELEWEEGILQGLSAIRYKVFDPNNYQPFNSILFVNEKPVSVNVQPEYWIEQEFIKN